MLLLCLLAATRDPSSKAGRERGTGRGRRERTDGGGIHTVPPAYKTNGFVERKFALKTGWTYPIDHPISVSSSVYRWRRAAAAYVLHLGVILLEIQVQTAREQCNGGGGGGR